MGGDYGRGFWSVALFLRCAGLLVGLALSSVAFSDVIGSAERERTFECQNDVYSSSNCDWPHSTYGTIAGQRAAACEANVNQRRSCVGPEDVAPYYTRWYVYACPPGTYILGQTCYDEPPPEPECPIPAGDIQQVVSSSPLGSDACYSNCVMTTSSSGSVPWVQVNGVRRYFYDATSTGVYCDESDGAEPSEPWDEYTDEDGCYQGFDGRYCPGGGGGCPNFVTAPNGQTYCRAPETDESCNEAGGSTGDWYCSQDDPNYEEPSDGDGNADSDGDGIPNKDDPAPQDPDADGDGTQDGEQDGDGNGIPDGDPGGIDDGEGDGNEPGDGYHDGGTCEPGERVEPECSDNMDAIQCALAIELFHVRCDSKMRVDEIIGDDEFRDGPSVTDDGDSDGDGTADNEVPGNTLNAGSVVEGLSEDKISFGNLGCPADRTFSMPGAFGGSFTLSWEPICDFAGMIRPIVIALGYLASGLIILRRFSGGGD